ncbi:coatomer subunit gamma-2 [Capsaspora owczarzaki ATCC 30864]|uniref:Coatomer subunit gamma n=1 Tax=Capsaspora owczarzaki (strain ATCC 30864) TaxID=595528 RepID=A0A0D2WQJ5_CAPO3|nr:coatomer subunit gamma-2 [Capsaspora owczarzaki ATCC 30864]KJE93213.1 coatomer subunit gamma-2 [Capsaspora owczarzaki ATCC 30864]|eukprot:XP_004347858.1 coatomer subunit gamma-2 [Capsaspora owczarzaki ATCC 30864]
MSKKDEDGDYNPYASIDKSAVVQEARQAFNETTINPRRCNLVLNKLLFLLYSGEPLGTTEATETFFAITKLFQCKNITIRRLVYLAIKELAKVANDVIIVTSSLTKDMTAKEDMYRPAAIRALCRITDSTMLQGIERYMKQAIVDRNPAVSSAALVSSLHLLGSNQDIIKRWVNEITEALNGKTLMAQYHALGLLYHIKQRDRLAVTKLVTSQTKGSLRSSLAYCNLIRYAVGSMQDDPALYNELLQFLDLCLRHKSELVVYEAARAICSLKNVTNKDIIPALSVMQLFLTAPKSIMRFAAVRTLSQVANRYPTAVAVTNIELENLIQDSNRSIATLAITTLLKTGREASVDRLMTQITPFMSEISDEFKIVVIDAIRTLCLKFPQKHIVVLDFLSAVFRDDGSFEYKKAIVDTITSIIHEIPAAREIALNHLAEFVEDCEHPALSARALHMLGRLAPQSSFPSRYVRIIYNRVVLESPIVRAAAVSSLAKFAVSPNSSNLAPMIIALLSRCLHDTDDEVRDRAAFYLRVLSSDEAHVKSFIMSDLPYSITALERSLVDYLKNPSATPFNLKTVPLQAPSAKPEFSKADIMAGVVPSSAAVAGSAAALAAAGGIAAVGGAAGINLSAAQQQDRNAARLAAHPELGQLGPLFRSSKPTPLTEAETEYVVSCTRHIFSRAVVFEYELTNTLNDQLLEDVKVQLDCPDGFIVRKVIPAKSLPYGKPAFSYVVVELPQDPKIVSGTFSNTLKFLVKDCDPNTGEPDDEQGYPDEYLVEDVELQVSDQVVPIEFPDFAAAWNALPQDSEVSDTFELASMKSLEEAVSTVIGFLGLFSCGRPQPNASKSAQALQLSGVFRGGDQVLVNAKLLFKGPGEGVAMQLTVRSSNLQTSEIIASAVG